jgi:hypothetical protein
MSATLPDPSSFLSGDAGDVTDPWRRAKRTAGELAYNALDTLAGTRRRAARLAQTTRAPLDILVIGVYRPGSLFADVSRSLHSDRHNVRIALGSTGRADPRIREHTVAENLTGGKFENLNRVLESAEVLGSAEMLGSAEVPTGAEVGPAPANAPGGPAHAPGGPAPGDPAHAPGRPAPGDPAHAPGGPAPSDPAPAPGGPAPSDPAPAPGGPVSPAGGPAAGPDWVLVVDDDVRFPRAFVDRFVAVCEVFGLDLAQPAQTLRSHSAWKVTRRRPATLVRQTRFVEIGPVTAFSRRAAAELLPFPELRYGWGLDLHWAAIAGQRGWRLGIVDALPVRHESGLVAATYSREDAEAEAARFLADRPYLPSVRTSEVIAVHRTARHRDGRRSVGAGSRA